MTRSAGSTNVDAQANHDHHLAFTSGTKAAIRVDGTWKGKADGTYTKGSIIIGSIANEVVTQTTTATIKNETSNGSKHNAIEFSSAEQLYWDDYGTADPTNMPSVTGNGRDIGLSIYAAAVNGVTTAPVIDGTTGKEWTALTWTLDADQKTNDWKNKDLLISNNIKTSGPDGTYRFDDRASGKLLEFKHAMSKITVRLIANEGFPTTGVGETTNKFASAPKVKLTGDEGDVSTNAYANTVCTINVTDGSYSNAGTPSVITMLQSTVPESQKSIYTAIYEALVAPGSVFGAPQTIDSKEVYPIIASINADDNIYYVTSEKIRAKIKDLIDASEHNNEYKTEPGKNYVITVKVNKTDIEVTATIKNWEDVEAAEVTPVINVNASYPGTGTGSNANFTSFSFYRSLKEANEYSKGYSGNANSYYAAEGAPTGTLGSGAAWTFTNKLYWPNHNTHYFFRGVWPLTSVSTDDVETKPHVKDNSDNTNQVIDIKNVAYTKNSYPSDLAIGMPNFTDDNKMCDSHANHTPIDQSVNGICATTGTIALNFQYVMSQVEVELQTVSDDAAVNIGTDTKVEIVNVYNNGYVKLGDREVICTDANQNLTYELDAKPTGGLSGDELTTAQRTRHSAVVPQSFIQGTAGASTNTRFKITVTNDDAVLYADATEYNAAKGTSIDDAGFAALSKIDKTKIPATTDIYFADVEPILKSDKSGKVAPNGKWESGVHYKYVLKLSKTEVNVTATIKDWVEVTASDNVWF